MFSRQRCRRQVRNSVLALVVLAAIAITGLICASGATFAAHCKAAWDRIGEGAILDRIEAAGRRGDMIEIWRLLPIHLHAMQQALRMHVDNPDCFHGQAKAGATKYRANIESRKRDIIRDCQR